MPRARSATSSSAASRRRPARPLWEQSRWIARDGVLRDFVLNEPRGGVFRHVNLLVPPKRPEADAAFIIMEPEDTPPMSGSNAICVATVLLGDRHRADDASPRPSWCWRPRPAWSASAPSAAMAGSGASAITNVPSFADRLGGAARGAGPRHADGRHGLWRRQLRHRRRARAGLRGRAGRGARAGRDRHPHHRAPRTSSWASATRRTRTGTISASARSPRRSRPSDGVKTGRNAVVVRPGKIDRSPTGTGCSARMAVLHARGELARRRGVPAASRSSARTSTAASRRRRRVAGRPAIVPVIAGRAWLTGTRQLMLDPDDPWPGGYRLSDTWPRLG